MPTRGSYALVFAILIPTQVRIGCLGRFSLEAGRYVYLGSARGSGGLEARLKHHLNPVTNPHWHLDWLHSLMHIEGYCWINSPDPFECTWSQAFGNLEGIYVPIPGFGASDCNRNCPAHLYQLPQNTGVSELAAYLTGFSSSAPIHHWKKQNEWTCDS